MRMIILTSVLLWTVILGAGFVIHSCYAEPADLVYEPSNLNLCSTECFEDGCYLVNVDKTGCQCDCESGFSVTEPPPVDAPGDWVPTSIDITNESDCDLLCEVLGCDRSFYEPGADQCYCFEEDEG